MSRMHLSPAERIVIKVLARTVAGRIRPLAARQRRERGCLLRQYCPRGISLHLITKELLRNAAKRPTKRPRNRLTHQTPAEVLKQAITSALAS